MSDPAVIRLRKEARAAWLLATISTLLSAFLLIAGLAPSGRSSDVIRVRGIVIVDAQGHDRILIGAPIPTSRDRIRSDFEKAQRAWGGRYPDFEWYRALDHSTNGIVVLDERGYDRIVLGDPDPDPNIGKRVAPVSGIVVNDRDGFERTGWGHFPTLNRTALGLDTPKGDEGVMVGVLDDSTAGVMVMDGGPSIFLGNAGPDHFITGLKQPFNGLLIRQGEVVKYNLNSR
jgi:hypothetical protein